MDGEFLKNVQSQAYLVVKYGSTSPPRRLTTLFNQTTFVMERKFYIPISQPRYNTGTWIFFVNFEVLHQKTPITTYIYFIFYQYFILASVRKLEHSPSLGSGIRPSRLRQPSTHSVSIVRSTALVKSATLESFLVPIAHK